jgi:cell wall-associated NlpC family hydrolase
LRGQVEALRFVAPSILQVIEPSVPLRSRPDAAASWTTEALFGETVRVFEARNGWAWVQLVVDGYVGYMHAGALNPHVEPSTHRVAALGTWLYPAADMKVPPSASLSMTAYLAVRDVGPSFARLADGRFVPVQHIAPLADVASDHVRVARAFLGVPYQWGGKTRAGLDCSGLVQVALAACGIAAPRDSDMQASELGDSIDPGHDLANVQRGDFIFWKGHVGIVSDADALLHANAFHMAVVEEPLRAAVARIAAAGSVVTGVRRLAQKV